MIQLRRLAHALIVVRDVERSKRFYTELLGFRVLEEDPGHGGVFLGLGPLSHTIDLFPTTDAGAGGPAKGPPMKGLGVQHLAFAVDSHDALKDAYFHLKDNGVDILTAIDHVNQESFYFHDPDENTLEVYWERPDSLEIFASGRGDRDDQPLTFER